MGIKKTMNEIQKCTKSRQINDAPNTRNGFSTACIHNLPINLPVLVYQKGNVGQSREWKELYNFFSMKSKLMIIELPYGSTKFRSTSIKPYFIDNTVVDDDSLMPNSSAPT